VSGKNNILLRAKLTGKWPPKVGTSVKVGVYRPGNMRCQGEHTGKIVSVYSPVSNVLAKEVTIRVLGGEVVFKAESGLRKLYARVST
jgi:hypothetical protein